MISKNRPPVTKRKTRKSHRLSGVITGTLTDGGVGGPNQIVTVTLGTPTGAALVAGGPFTATLHEAGPATHFSISGPTGATAGTPRASHHFRQEKPLFQARSEHFQ